MEPGDGFRFSVCDDLRGPLSKLMGTAGFRSLLSRARSMAGGEITWILELKIDAQGTLENLDEMSLKHSPSAMPEGERALVAYLIHLLVIFIGSSLTLGLLRDIWPEMEDLRI